MMERLTLGLVLAVILVVALSGCSGTGAPATDVAGASLRSFAADNLDALSLFAEWTKVLYPGPGGNTNPNGPEPQPDGSLRLWGTTSDGGEYEWFVLPDGSGHGSISWPGGLTFSQVLDAIVWSSDFGHSEEHFVNTYPGGSKLDCRVATDYRPAEKATWTGTATVGTTQPLSFELRRAYPGQDELRLTLADGRVFSTTIPHAGMVSSNLVPAYSTGLTGTFGLPGGSSTAFSASGDTRWRSWSVSEGTYSGQFALGADWSSNGQLRDGDTPAGALRWTSDFSGILDQLGMGQAQVTPSAAALSASIGRWCQNVNALSPMPMY